MSDVRLRPLRADEAEEAHRLSAHTFSVLDRGGAPPPLPPTPERLARGTARVAHLQRTDPDGAWGAFDGDRLVGVTLASRRGSLWFLSLLTVEPALQGQGIGHRLLDRALTTASAAPAALICSSEDPKALRRYGTAGFALLPAYRARGTLDRSRLPAVDGVREGDWDADRDLVEQIAVQVRGALVGPDLDAYAANGARLLLADGPAGRGYAVPFGQSCRPLAATTAAAARALLLAGLAELEGEVTVEFVTAEQQWAVQALLELRLPFKPGDSLCVRGFRPTGPYLPSGALG